ncbi:hypothetical protein NKH77_17010 [Streptomyces sp. M19]
MDLILQDWERPNGLEASWLNWCRATMNPDTSPRWIPFPTCPYLFCCSTP